MTLFYFSLRMLRRDARAGELRLLVAALVVAVAALTAVGFFSDRVRKALEQEANQLLGANELADVLAGFGEVVAKAVCFACGVLVELVHGDSPFKLGW